MQGHPTDLDLDLVRTGEADDEVRRHVETCAACREKVAFFARAASELGKVPAPIAVPPERETAILALARERAAEVRSKSKVESRKSKDDRRRSAGRQTVLRVVPWAAAAALALVIGGYVWLSRTSEPEAPPIMATAPQAVRPPSPPAAPHVAGVVAAGPDDLNGDGRVDIVDAYLMARSIERGRTERAWDKNRDGKVDRGDVDRIAFAAVSLRRGGGK
jgi:hypothetical protein